LDENGNRVFLSLGSNRGIRRKNIEDAITRLATCDVQVQVFSSYYETEPVYLKNQRDFVNSVCELRTGLEPKALLRECLGVEATMGRERTLDNGPRIIDIDILFYDDRILRDEELTIPHPLLFERRFVLVPMNEIAPGFCDPISGRTVAELLEACPDRSVVTRIGED
jgi:2-amino-4-hydroxy-6-hydroxymethyldihydropteridine diphosphokinase